MGYTTPTPIQEQTAPILFERKDLVGQAQTGSGKTTAFGLPMIEAVDPDLNRIQGLVLVPTRELALQVTGEVNRLAAYAGIHVVPIYGGEPIARQFRALDRGAHIIVGTPGRVIDHLTRGTIDLSHVRFAVLDEADEMLDIGFAQDMIKILRRTPRARQTALFSATVPTFIRRLIYYHLKDPVWVRIGEAIETVPEPSNSIAKSPSGTSWPASWKSSETPTPRTTPSSSVECRPVLIALPTSSTGAATIAVASTVDYHRVSGTR